MSQKQLDQYDASRIAKNLSEKAFAHLRMPIEADQSKLAKLAHEVALGSANSTTVALVAIGFAARTEVNVDVRSTSGQSLRVTYVGEEALVSPYAPIIVINNVLFDRATELQELLNPIITRQKALCIELRTQMFGKSAKAICKAWPEATQFVNAHFNISVGSNVPLTNPLDELLGRFLPALPAPTEQPA